MTKTSTTEAPRKITWRRVTGVGRVNPETGVMIVRQDIAGVRGARYMVTCPTKTGTDVIDDEMTMHEAQWAADERVELMRIVIEDDFEAAADFVAEVLADVAEAVEALDSRIATNLYRAALHSLTGHYRTWSLHAASERLCKVLNLLAEPTSAPSNAEADAALAEQVARLPRGQRVTLTTGQRNGMAGEVDGDVKLDAETGRPFVMVKLLAGGYRVEWCDSLVMVGTLRDDRLLAEVARQLG
jgi:hypothetical protein